MEGAAPSRGSSPNNKNTYIYKNNNYTFFLQISLMFNSVMKNFFNKSLMVAMSACVLPCLSVCAIPSLGLTNKTNLSLAMGRWYFDDY